MADGDRARFDPVGDGAERVPWLGVGSLAVAGLTFFVGGALVIQTDTPPSEDPLLGMLAHALWALGIVLLALGVVALLRWAPQLRRGVAGYVAAGVLGLGVLHGLQWVSWAYVDVRGASDADRTDLLLEAVVVPVGASYLLTYAILAGAGIASFAWVLRRTEPAHRSSAGRAWESGR